MFSIFFSCRIKEKFPYAFDDICLYSEVSHLLAHCMFRLTSRRFIQELFQDVQFMPVRRHTIISQSSLVVTVPMCNIHLFFSRCMRKQRQS